MLFKATPVPLINILDTIQGLDRLAYQQTMCSQTAMAALSHLITILSHTLMMFPIPGRLFIF